MQNPLRLNVLNRRFSLSCDDEQVQALLASCYGPFVVDDNGNQADFEISGQNGGWRLQGGQTDLHCPSLADLIYDVEKELTIRLQLERKDLLFAHAACVVKAGKATIIVGESGAGKSTLCWALSNASFSYMSDELAPIDPASLHVHSYPRALCLKSWPDAPFELPDTCHDLGRTLHLPASNLPGGICTNSPVPLARILFLRKEEPERGESAVRTLGDAEAAAHLYANALNQLAHEKAGLRTVAEIVSAVPTLEIRRQTLEKQVETVMALCGSHQRV